MQQNVANTPEQYYYGARYYDPKTSIWLGVDPMADKYPNISPFAYCSNNPITRIDPDGQDDYEVDKKTGDIKFVKATNEATHRLIAGHAKYDKKTGNLKNKKTLEIKKEVLDNMQEGKAQHKDENNNMTPYSYTRQDFEQDEKGAESAFRWFADNTKVEWTLLQYNDNGITKSGVITSHNSDKDYMGAFLTRQAANGDVLKRSVHNHPLLIDTSFASDDDRAIKNGLKPQNPPAVFQVYRMGRFKPY